MLLQEGFRASLRGMVLRREGRWAVQRSLSNNPEYRCFVHGSEQDNYTCKQFSGSGSCTAWEGDITGIEDVEWTRCECTDSSDCRAPDAQWKCDEYELPKRLDMSHYVGDWIWFLYVELLLILVFLLYGGFGSWFSEASSGDLFESVVMGCCFSSCVGVILLPFLVVSWGLGGFMKLSLPFWILRGLCALGLLGVAAYRRVIGRIRSNNEVGIHQLPVSGLSA